MPKEVQTALYIEDEPEMIDLVRLILTPKKFKVIGADGGRAGIECVQSVNPDVILLDLMMPDLDGWDVYHQLKSSEQTRDIPVIVITAKAQAIDKVLALKIAKVDDYIAKPFTPQELMNSLEKVLGEGIAQS